MRSPMYQVLGILILAGAAQAADFVGPSKCTGCHEHQRQTLKWRSEEPKTFGKEAHFNALKRLEEPASKKYATAIGLSDPFEIKGNRTCVKCHATVFKGDANAGVSCESCHGAASGYLDIHQVKGNYGKSVAAGMRDLRERPTTIAGRCAECHSIKDSELVAAGHPAGEGFNGGDQLRKIVHWDTQYNFAQVASAYAAVAGRATRVATQSSEPTPKPTPKPTQVSIKPGPPSTPVNPRSTPTNTRPSLTSGTDTNWWNEAKKLPPTYRPPLPVRTSRVEPPSTGRSTPSPRVDTPSRDDAPPPPPPPSDPLPDPEPPVDRETPLITPPSARSAQLRSEALSLLDRLLKNGSRLSTLPPPGAPSEFKGPDGELYRIQDEALALVIEALRSRK